MHPRSHFTDQSSWRTYPNDIDRSLRFHETERTVPLSTDFSWQAFQCRINFGHGISDVVDNFVLFRHFFPLWREPFLAMADSPGGGASLQLLQSTLSSVTPRPMLLLIWWC
jgi:hypothetical protein